MAPLPLAHPRDHDRGAPAPPASRCGRHDAAGRPVASVPFAPFPRRFAGRVAAVGWTTAGAMAPVDVTVHVGNGSVGVRDVACARIARRGWAF